MRKPLSGTLLSVMFLSVVLLLPCAASGTTITYRFTGVLDSVSGDDTAMAIWNSDVQATVGDSVFGTLSYNPDAPIGDTFDNQIVYNTFTYSMHVGKLIVSSSNPFAVQTYLGKGADVSELNFWDIVPASNIPAVLEDDMNMEIIYEKVIAVNGELPKNLFVNFIRSMGFFATGNFAFEGVEGADFGVTVNSISPVAPVPEPASMFLLTSGLAGLA